MKRILLLCLALLLLAPGAAFAHSKLETAEPGVNATIGESPDTIEMTFDTFIEKISNFRLFNELDEQVELGETIVDGSLMMADVPNALANGQYTVKWTIVGADGHPVSGEYSFTVDAPELEETAPPADGGTEGGTVDGETPADTPGETPEETPDDASPEATEAPASEPEASPTPPADSADSGGGTNYAPFMIIGSIIVVAAALTVVLRRRKS